jgi:subtilisin family serine protease
LTVSVLVSSFKYNKELKKMKKIFSGKVLAMVIILNIAFGQFGALWNMSGVRAAENVQSAINVGQDRSRETQNRQPQHVDENKNYSSGMAGADSNSSSKSGKSKRSEYIPGEIIIKFKSDKINLKNQSGVEKSGKFAKDRNLDKKEDLEKSNISVLRIKDAKTVEEKMAELKNDPNVEYSQPNFQYYPSSINTDDTYKDNLWGLDNTGQNVNGTSGSNDADIDAPEAWIINEGSNASVIVAVIDDGVAYNHPDLINDMWNGTDCKDENGNALGNCNHGYDFEDGDKTPLPIDGSHGTHVAGTIAASKNNGKGIIGVAPQAKIMAIKFSFTTANAIRGINFAKQNGAKVINASWGGTDYDQSLKDAIASFPGLFIAAAGNSGRDNDGGTHNYPSDFDLDNVIAVAATDQRDALASFSNYGTTSVDVGAPGTNIYSTVSGNSVLGTSYLSENFEELAPPGIPSGWVRGGTNNNWGTYNYGGSLGNVLYGDLNHPYANSANTTLTSPVFDLSGSTGATISFFSGCDTEYDVNYFQDYMVLEYSSDGGNNFTPALRWDEVYIDSLNGDSSSTGGATYNFGLDIPSAYLNNNFKFKLRWVTNSSLNDYDGCFVDNMKITKYTDGSNEAYDYASGTSMATPHVAGLAALIWGYRPALSSSQVKNVILTTGDSIPSLSGKTVSGKRINAGSALRSLTPAATVSYDITDLTKNDVVATLHPDAGLTVTSEGGLTHTFTANGSFTFEFTDAYGDTGSVVATVNNIDKTAPVISLSGNPIVYVIKDGSFVDAGATATDNHDGPVNVTVSGTVDTNTVGTYTLTYTSTDAAGNIATATRTVNVLDRLDLKSISSFSFAGSAGVIDEENRTISVTVPYGTDITNLAPVIAIIGTSVSPASAAIQNFTDHVIYTVTAADNSTETYTVTVVIAPGTAATPTFSPLQGSYTGAQSVTISSLTDGASIYYTTDGSAPASSSMLYTSAITISSSATLKAIAVKSGFIDSAVASAVYTINIPSGGGGGGGGGSYAPTVPTILKAEIKSVSGNNLVLNLSVSNASQMMISDSSSFNGASWIAYAASPIYTKKDADSKLYLKFKSSGGAISSVAELSIPSSDNTVAGSDNTSNINSNSSDLSASSNNASAYPDGTLLKLASSPRVYVVMSGKKKWISTPEVFEQLGYTWTSITTVSDAQLVALPDYEDNLIREKNGYKVYLVVNGVKRHIPNPEIFLDYGFAWNDVKDVDASVIDKYKDTPLIKETGTNGIYYVNSSGIRKLIPTDDILASYNEKMEDVQIVSKLEMESYPLSNLIRLNTSNDVYLIQGNLKKHIPNIKIANKYKLNLNQVMSVNQQEYNFYQSGGELK